MAAPAFAARRCHNRASPGRAKTWEEIGAKNSISSSFLSIRYKELVKPMEINMISSVTKMIPKVILLRPT
jgi:hypothetical protein